MFLTILFVDQKQTVINRVRHLFDQCKLNHKLVVVTNLVNEFRAAGKAGSDNHAGGLMGEENADWRLDDEERRASGLDLGGGRSTLKGAARAVGLEMERVAESLLLGVGERVI